MESIALGYLNIDEEKIKNMKAARRDYTEGFVRDMIREWARRNPYNQVQVRIRSNLIMFFMVHLNRVSAEIPRDVSAGSFCLLKSLP